LVQHFHPTLVSQTPLNTPQSPADNSPAPSTAGNASAPRL
jgi:hypothetical protein